MIQKEMLLGKVHRATITHCELHYEGSCAMDETLMAAAGIVEFQRLDIYVIDNGERFSTYAMKAKTGSGIISLNGAAARRAQRGDRVIIATYGLVSGDDLANFKPQLVFVDDHNRITEVRQHIPEQC